MTNPISQAAIEAGAKARAEARGTDWENLKHTFPGMAKNIRAETRSALKAAMPRIRKQVADEIRAVEPDRAAFNQMVRDHSVDYGNGYTDAIHAAARVVEGSQK